MKKIEKQYDQIITLENLTFKLPTGENEVEVFDGDYCFDNFTYCYDERNKTTFKKSCMEWLNEQ